MCPSCATVNSPAEATSLRCGLQPRAMPSPPPRGRCRQPSSAGRSPRPSSAARRIIASWTRRRGRPSRSPSAPTGSDLHPPSASHLMTPAHRVLASNTFRSPRSDSGCKDCSRHWRILLKCDPCCPVIALILHVQLNPWANVILQWRPHREDHLLSNRAHVASNARPHEDALGGARVSTTFLHFAVCDPIGRHESHMIPRLAPPETSLICKVFVQQHCRLVLLLVRRVRLPGANCH